MRNASDLFTELNAVDESIQIEAKRASEIGKSVMQTVIAFANEPGLRGGYLLLGADWKTDEKGDVVYWAHGLADPDKIQRDLASQCASTLNVAVRPEMRMEMVDGRAVLVVFVPESDVSQKSVYVKATGLPRGAYRRIGSTDQYFVDEDLWVLRGETQPQTWPDMAVIGDASRDDIDPQAVAEYRRLRVEANAGAEGLAYGDDDLLEAICALRRIKGELKPTIAGVVMFGKALALRRLMPALRVDYIRVPGTQWVDDPDNRFATTLDVRKPLLLALRQVQNTILDELPKGFRLDEGELQSRQEPLLPRKVIREAVANATMHRSYQIHNPVQIIRYSHRIEVINPGFSLKDVTDLGKPGSRLRNPAIAAVLHDIHWAETKGSGIRTMRRLSAEAGLPLPEFSSDRQRNREGLQVAVAGVSICAAFQRSRQADLARPRRQDHRADPPERACRCRARRSGHPASRCRSAGSGALQPGPGEGKEIEIKVARRLRKHLDNPKFKALSERLDALRGRFESGVLNRVEFLKQLLQIAREVLQAEKETPPEEDVDRGKAALSELFNEVRTAKTPIVVERVVADIDEIVRLVRFPACRTLFPASGKSRRRYASRSSGSNCTPTRNCLKRPTITSDSTTDGRCSGNTTAS